MPSPAWLTQEYAEHLLGEKVVEVKVTPAGGDGANYASVIWKLGGSTTSGGNFGFIVKTITEQEEAKGVLEGEFNVHNKEMFIYEVVLPVYASLFIGAKIAPRIFAVDRSHQAIVLEDLTELSFKTADRVGGLDESHWKLVIDKLAKLHAGSVHLSKIKPGIFDLFTDGLFNRKIKLLHEYYQATLGILIEEISSWKSQEFSDVVEYLRNLEPFLIEMGSSVFDNLETEFRVFLHGDLWTSNIMFQYGEDGAVLDSVLIDYQMSSLASPVVDLLYFWFTSVEEKDRVEEEKQMEFLKYYHAKLKEALESLHEEAPEIEQIKQAWDRKFFHAFTASVMFMPFMIHEGKADIALIMGTHEPAIEFKRQLFKNPKVRRVLEKLLPAFSTKGIFQVPKEL